MLTIRAMSNGSGYAKQHLEQNDYYAEGEKVVGQWFGKGAEMLGLRNAVSLEQFESVRQGLHPETGEMLRPRKSADRETKDGTKQSEGRSLYDCTFSAPKSISIMTMIGGDSRLIEAHNQAVQETLIEMERCAATRVRMGAQNNDRVTGNLVVACYQHDTSRRLDPQLHTHAVAANLPMTTPKHAGKRFRLPAFTRDALTLLRFIGTYLPIKSSHWATKSKIEFRPKAKTLDLRSKAHPKS